MNICINKELSKELFTLSTQLYYKYILYLVNFQLKKSLSISNLLTVTDSLTPIIQLDRSYSIFLFLFLEYTLSLTFFSYFCHGFTGSLCLDSLFSC